MELAKKLLSALFPSRCLLCQKTVDQQVDNSTLEICAECYQALPHNTASCIQCALPLADEQLDEVLCGRCIKKPPAFDYAYSPFRYEDDVIRLMHQLKFGEKITFSRTCGEMLLQLLEEKITRENIKPDCLLPVPLHPARLRQRGFNQSIELARVISKKLNIPIEYDAVRRNRSTTSQLGLDAKARRKNIKGAFSVKHKLNARHVLIIDDVMTTGSTVNELARALKTNGVKHVGVLSFARAPIKN